MFRTDDKGAAVSGVSAKEIFVAKDEHQSPVYRQVRSLEQVTTVSDYGLLFSTKDLRNRRQNVHVWEPEMYGPPFYVCVSVSIGFISMNRTVYLIVCLMPIEGFCFLCA